MRWATHTSARRLLQTSGYGLTMTSVVRPRRGRVGQPLPIRRDLREVFVAVRSDERTRIGLSKTQEEDVLSRPAGLRGEQRRAVRRERHRHLQDGTGGELLDLSRAIRRLLKRVETGATGQKRYARSIPAPHRPRPRQAATC